MKERYIVSIDQSTQGTKALLFREDGRLIAREDLPHRQIVNELGWVSHDPEEIYENTVSVVKALLQNNPQAKDDVIAIGISNQRETSLMWNRETGKPIGHAIVWQCARAKEICERDVIKKQSEMIQRRTGIKLSPYFPAAKIAWLLENETGAKELAMEHKVCHGTIDSWLVYQMTEGKSYRTDYSNASRTQLFDIENLCWDKEICELFGVEPENLAEVTDSDGFYGETTLNGTFSKPVPIRGVLGDSHGALFGQGCLKPGMLKATYGTGSSIMMNIGTKLVHSKHGVVTSLAWGRGGKVNYVLEGNLNYTGAVITWLKDGLQIIQSPGETEKLAKEANQEDSVYLVPAFTGLGAPYWDSNAKASIVGMDRRTGKPEIVRATLECIAYQITDVVKAMEEDAKVDVKELRVDGGPTKNSYLMQFQSDVLNAEIQVPEAEELSGIGAAYMAGMAVRLWNEDIWNHMKRNVYHPTMDERQRLDKYAGWQEAVASVLDK